MWPLPILQKLHCTYVLMHASVLQSLTYKIPGISLYKMLAIAYAPYDNHRPLLSLKSFFTGKPMHPEELPMPYNPSWPSRTEPDWLVCPFTKLLQPSIYDPTGLIYFCKLCQQRKSVNGSAWLTEIFIWINAEVHAL